MLYPQFIYDPGLRNDDKLKPIQLPLSRSSSLSKSRTLTTSTCENVPLTTLLLLSHRSQCHITWQFKRFSSVNMLMSRCWSVWLCSCDAQTNYSNTDWRWACVQLLWLSCWQIQRTLLCLELHPVELRAEQAITRQICPKPSSRLWSKSCRISTCLTERSSSSCSYQTVCQADRMLTPLLNLQQMDLPERKRSLETRGLHIFKH